MTSLEKGTSRWQASLYHSARPSYPTETIEAILNAALSDASSDSTTTTSSSTGAKRPLRILEIGSGTGISTEAMLRGAASLDIPIGEYVAVEPSLAMRKGWDEYMLEKLVPSLQSSNQLSPSAKISCKDGTFSELHSGTGWDLILIAQAYHWCPDYTASLKACAEALRTGGKLALLWNLEDRETGAKWVGRLRDIYEAHEDDVPQYHTGAWRSLYDSPSMSLFTPLPETTAHRCIPTTVSGVVDRALSKSFIARLDQGEKDKVKGQIEDIFRTSGDGELGRKWIDEEKGVFEYPYRTDLFLLQKK